jgi:hypothetical protein
MRIQYKAWTLALLGLLFAAPAFADEGPYVYVTAGAGLAYNACQSPLIVPGTTCNDKSAVFRAGFGYQYTPMWALEASYGQYGYANAAGYGIFNFPAPTGPGVGSFSWQLKATGPAVQAVWTLHMTDTFATFVKFGAAYVNYDEYENVVAASNGTSWYIAPTASTARLNPAAGVGLRYDVGPHGTLFVVGEYFGQNNIYNVYGVGAKVRLVTGSFGLMWRY